MAVITRNLSAPLISERNRWIVDTLGELLNVSGGVPIRSTIDADHEVDIAPVTCFDSTGKVLIKTGQTLTCDIEQSGAGGLDTGAVAALTWYAVFVVLNVQTRQVVALFSLSRDAPTLPQGYRYFRRVGWFRTDSSANLLDLRTLSSGRERVISYEYVNRLQGQRITSGITVPNSPTNIALDCSVAAPPGVRRLHCWLSTKTFPATTLFLLYFWPDGSAVALGTVLSVTGQDSTEAAPIIRDFTLPFHLPENRLMRATGFSAGDLGNIRNLDPIYFVDEL